MWDPTLDVGALMRDFIGSYYGEAAPAVWDYHRLLWDYAARYNDYERRRHWVYGIDDEGMFGHGFVEKATAILNRGMASTDDPAIRERVERLQLGVDFVEISQLLRSLRDGKFQGERQDLQNTQDRFFARADRLGINDLTYFDGVRVEKTTDDLRAAFALAESRLFDRNFVAADRWTEWGLRLDPDDVGVAKRWYQGEDGSPEDWTPVEVPAFLGEAEATAPTGYFWYRAAFRLTEAEAAQPARLLFGGVDEQAWVYLKGEYLGEHTLESEFVVGDEVTVADLWDRPFELPIEPNRLKAGWNAIYVRVHNSAYNGGIHSPVELELIAEPESLSLKEDFRGAPRGPVEAGEAFTTSAGDAFGTWRVTQGAVSFDGTPPSPGALDPESEGLAFAPGGSTLRFDLKQAIMGGLDISFQLRQLDFLANMNVVRVRLIDAEGRNITLGMSTLGPHYGPGGQSGFAIFDAEGDARIGPKGVRLRTDTDPQAIRLTFDPRDGLAFYYDGSEMPTVRIPGVPGLGPIEAIELLTSQGATWVVEELAIESL